MAKPPKKKEPASESKSVKTPPNVVPKDNWEKVDLPFNIGSGRTLYSGLEQNSRLRLRVFRRKDDHHLVGQVWFGPGADGPPGHAHGGAVAYVLDEAMGSVAWMNEYPALAAKLSFEYFRMTPLETDLLIEAWIEKVTERRLTIHASLSLASGEICVAGQGQFAIVAKSKMGQMGAIPDVDVPKIINNPRLKWAAE